MTKNFDFQQRAYILSRSLLLISTLLVLIFNNTNVMMSYNKEQLNCTNLPIPTTFCIADQINISYKLMRLIMIIILFIAPIRVYPTINRDSPLVHMLQHPTKFFTSRWWRSNSNGYHFLTNTYNITRLQNKLFLI